MKYIYLILSGEASPRIHMLSCLLRQLQPLSKPTKLTECQLSNIYRCKHEMLQLIRSDIPRNMGILSLENFNFERFMGNIKLQILDSSQ